MHYKWIYVIAVLVCPLMAAGNTVSRATEPVVEDYQLMLLGGDLHYCRSMALRFCNSAGENVLGRQQNRRRQFYKLTPRQVEAAMAANMWHADRQAMRHDLNLVLQELSRQVASQPLSRRELLTAWKGVSVKQNNRILSGHSLFLQLHKHEYQMILDFLELPMLDQFEDRIVEQAALKHTREPVTEKLLRTFINLASKDPNSEKQPLILVLTAGERDPFANVDTLEEVIASIGAQVHWLPLDGALQSLWADRKPCGQLESYRNRLGNNYDRQRIYPDLVARQQALCNNPAQVGEWLSKADGLLLSGGQPHFLKRTLVAADGKPTPALSMIRQRISQRQLVVATVATSTNAMSGGKDLTGKQTAMLLGGTSEMGFNHGSFNRQQVSDCQGVGKCLTGELIYNHQGGIGLFPWGVLDVEMSDNGHQGRLSKVSFDNGNRYGFGVDKNTALLVSHEPGSDRVDLGIAGEGGVLIVDHQQTRQTNGGLGLTNVSLNYFTRDDQVVLSQTGLSAEFAEWKRVPQRLKAPVTNNQNLFYGNNFRRFMEQACLSETNISKGYAGKKREFSVLLDRPNEARIMIGGVKRDSGYSFYCSFQNFRWTISRR